MSDWVWSLVGLVALALGYVTVWWFIRCGHAFRRQYKEIQRRGLNSGRLRGQDVLDRTPASPEPEGRTGPVVVSDVND